MIGRERTGILSPNHIRAFMRRIVTPREHPNVSARRAFARPAPAPPRVAMPPTTRIVTSIAAGLRARQGGLTANVSTDVLDRPLDRTRRG